MSLGNGIGFQGEEEDRSRTNGEMNRALLDFYLCPERFVDFEISGRLSHTAGYFRFGQDYVLREICCRISSFAT